MVRRKNLRARSPRSLLSLSLFSSYSSPLFHSIFFYLPRSYLCVASSGLLKILKEPTHRRRYTRFTTLPPVKRRVRIFLLPTRRSADVTREFELYKGYVSDTLLTGTVSVTRTGNFSTL